MIRRILNAIFAPMLARAMRALIVRQFKEQEVLAVIGGIWTPLYVRGVTMKREDGGVRFELRCAERKYPVISATSKTAPERIYVLGYRQIKKTAGGRFHYYEDRLI